MKRIAVVAGAILLVSMLALSLLSCGSSGGGGVTGSSNWDQMVWDVDNWK